MKKYVLSLALLMAMTLSVSAQSVEKRYNTDKGKLTVTSAENLFIDCDLRMCSFLPKGSTEARYGLELDLTDRVYYASKGNLLTIVFKDNSTIELENLFDTKAEISQESHVESHPEYRTTFVPVYDPWLDAFYSEAVTQRFTQVVPVTTTTSFADLYYKITPEQIDKILHNKVKEIRIVTDQGTIVKKARPFRDAIAALYPLVMSSKVQAMP